ncbi:HNH endonuclease [uncultured Roseivirga sp.]|uniref:HNH endonuclease signature motif containing protein n=1 Tax=uncultured Roseivirga sp. TaxID=543088 RepID=UPI0030D94A09|tara:strand:+ start:328172 stop:328861 length:690 start_codon:yes stop_codon:yes gene_type:complete
MTKSRNTIPQKTKVRAELQKEIDSVCPFCVSQDVGHFEIHHIDENPSNNILENLILICPTCHSKITKGDIPPIEVQEKKIELLLNPRIKETSETRTIIDVNGNLGNVIVGNNNILNIKNLGKKENIRGAHGTIGSDSLKADYIGYLKERYDTYLKRDLGLKINYAITGSRLKKRFKVAQSRTINDLPLHKFDEVVDVLIKWIQGTTLYKMKGKSQKMYSTFDEFVEKYR